MKSYKIITITALSTLAAGLLLGWLIFGSSADETESGHLHETESITGKDQTAGTAEIWTCSMHPQIRQNEPGDCPICGMDLIPLEKEDNSQVDAASISMSPTAMQLASVSTAIVGSIKPIKSIRLNGKVQQDERREFIQASHIPGRVENLIVNFTGDYITKGQVIASVYSPDLVTAQEELLEAQKIKTSQPQLFEAAREKLKNWKLSDKQIRQILNSGTTAETFDIRADVAGFVTEKMVNPGDYLRRGEAIYKIADLSTVWVLFDVYESDLPWISQGDSIGFTIASLPGDSFKGTISFLDPVIDPNTRVAKARVIASNPGLRLKPEMFASGTVTADLLQKTDAVVVPKTAVMWTGERSVVYVKSPTAQGMNFRMREVSLGPALGESYLIEKGLDKGEEIAVHGTFSIDAAAQLAGKPSMMNPSGGAAMTGHKHGGMDMPTTITESTPGKSAQSEGFTKSEALTKNTSPTFKAQLTGVYKAYIDMKNAYVDTDAKRVRTKAKDVMAALDIVNMELLQGNAHVLWMNQQKILNNALKTISQSSDIEKQRKMFSSFNQAFYESLKTFGLAGQTAYYQYCPMAFDNQGAYWLSSDKEIRNPYFGDKMLKCGETRETIQ